MILYSHGTEYLFYALFHRFPAVSSSKRGFPGRDRSSSPKNGSYEKSIYAA